MIRAKVKLAIYDLSRGLAIQLSEAILGQRIDGIWHTGVIVYGQEYFFGGGIQMLPEGQFGLANGMQATITELGETEVTREIFHEYIESISHMFTQQTYDLIRNNCNNFSDTITRFLLGQGIPSHIVDLPSIVFSTPGGMMLRPMIENMQNSIQQQGMANSLDPFGGISNRSSVNPPFPPTNVNMNIQQPPSNPPVVPTTHNLRKGLPAAYISSPSPLISAENDSSMMISMFHKLLKIPLDDNSPLTSEDMIALEDTAQQIKSSVTKHVPAPPPTTTTTTTTTTTNGITTTTIMNSETFSLESFATIGKILENYPKYEMTALYLLRVMVLSFNHSKEANIPNRVTDILRNIIKKLMIGQSSFSSISSMIMALCTISNLLSTKLGTQWFFSDLKAQYVSDDQVVVTTQSPSSTNNSNDTVDRFIDVMITYLSHSRVEVRQLVSAILYNITIVCTPSERRGWKIHEAVTSKDTTISPSTVTDMMSVSITPLTTTPSSSSSSLATLSESNGNHEADDRSLHGMAVQILCGTLEGVVDEVDATCRTRRLMTISRVLRACGSPAYILFRDLGFDEMLSEHIKRVEINDNKERELCTEIVHVTLHEGVTSITP